MIKGVIFDYGGTLDTGGDHWSEVIWNAYQQCGVAVDKGEFREAYVNAERELARTRHILPEHDFNNLITVKVKLELQWLSENGHFPPAQVEPMGEKVGAVCYEFARSKVAEAKPVLETLAKKYKLVLVSNFYGNIATVLKDFGIYEYFSDIVESAVAGVRKPDPKIFQLGVEKIGAPASEVVVVGDSYRKDIEPAEKIGCKTIWLKGAAWDDADAGIQHPNTITSLAQCLPIIEGM